MENKLKILVTAPYILPVIDKFKWIFDKYDIKLVCPEVNERFEEEDILAYAGEFDGTICGDDRYSKRVLSACRPRLKVISKWGTGIDSIDKATAEEIGIQVCNTTNAFTIPVSDTILGYVLSFARNLFALDANMKNGVWEKIPGKSLSEYTIGIIGMGNIGKAVSLKAKAFGMRILGNDIINIPTDFVERSGVQMVALKELAMQADFLVLCCTLDDSSYHIVDEEILSLLKPTAVIINTARGPLIDEQALVEVLSGNKIAGAALDVFEHEPLPANNTLRTFSNVMLSPHNSNSSPIAWENVHKSTIRNLLNGLGISHQGKI